MGKPRTWRELLGASIETSQERQRIANELGVRTITLTRWVNHESEPRPQNLRHLLRALPQHYELLLSLIEDEYPNFRASLAEEDMASASTTIPTEFYDRVLHALANHPRMLRTQAIYDLVLQQILKHLDPGRVGMSVSVVLCLPPLHGDIVHSMRESVSMGTPPWHTDPGQQTIFLGAESLAGYAVTYRRSVAAQNPEERQHLFPAHWVEHEQSAAASPIMREGKVVGCLVVSSAQPYYFVPFRQALVERYASLLALIFEPDEFYPIEQIELRLMPPHEEQLPYFANFRDRVLDTMRLAAQEGQSLSYTQAQLSVWQQIEEELIQYPMHARRIDEIGETDEDEGVGKGV